jgi:L-asparaginase / beta-aspartyl-peptidase
MAQDVSIMPAGKPQLSGNWVLVLHGGAGNPVFDKTGDRTEQAYRTGLKTALDLGGKILKEGGTAVDAVEAVVKNLEDNPLFNAGKGAVLNEEGKAELDASIMDGRTLMAGSVACVTRIKNPVSAARKVMENSQHVMLVGAGAEKFAKVMGLELVDPSYFITPSQLEKYKKSKPAPPSKIGPALKKDDGHGTVGCVAMDQYGNLAAATSTGGTPLKLQGRVGDSPIIGAGTYANNGTCAISCTGHGEVFMRYLVAYDVAAMMEYRGMSMEEAARMIIQEKIKDKKGEGGLIGVDREGHITMEFNTPGMFRAFLRENGETNIAITK